MERMAALRAPAAFNGAAPRGVLHSSQDALPVNVLSGKIPRSMPNLQASSTVAPAALDQLEDRLRSALGQSEMQLRAEQSALVLKVQEIMSFQAQTLKETMALEVQECAIALEEQLREAVALEISDKIDAMEWVREQGISATPAASAPPAAAPAVSQVTLLQEGLNTLSAAWEDKLSAVENQVSDNASFTTSLVAELVEFYGLEQLKAGITLPENLSKLEMEVQLCREASEEASQRMKVLEAGLEFPQTLSKLETTVQSENFSKLEKEIQVCNEASEDALRRIQALEVEVSVHTQKILDESVERSALAFAVETMQSTSTKAAGAQPASPKSQMRKASFEFGDNAGKDAGLRDDSYALLVHAVQDNINERLDEMEQTRREELRTTLSSAMSTYEQQISSLVSTMAILASKNDAEGSDQSAALSRIGLEVEPGQVSAKGELLLAHEERLDQVEAGVMDLSYKVQAFENTLASREEAKGMFGW